MKSYHEVLKIIAPSVNKEGLENLLTEEQFGDIEVQQNLLVESPDLKPQFHLKAVEYLKEKGVFKRAASTQVDCLLKSLRDQKEKMENQNKDIKTKTLAKQKAKECQKTILESFKKTS